MWISTPCNSNFVHRYDAHFMLYTFENSAIFLTNFLLFPKSSSFSFRASVQILICELYVVLVISRNQCRFCHPLFVCIEHTRWKVFLKLIKFWIMLLIIWERLCILNLLEKPIAVPCPCIIIINNNHHH